MMYDDGGVITSLILSVIVSDLQREAAGGGRH